VRHRIYVPLRDDPSVLCESDAVAAGDGSFRLVGSSPSKMGLLYRRGEIVECEIRAMPNGSKALVATRSISVDPEFRKTRTVFAVTGAIFGAGLGALTGLWIDFSALSFASGFVIGAIVLSYCSVRWRDSAWALLSRAMQWR